MLFRGGWRFVSLILVGLVGSAAWAQDPDDGRGGSGASPSTTPPGIESTDLGALVALQAAVEQLQSTVSTHTEVLRNQTAISAELSQRIQTNQKLIETNSSVVSEFRKEVQANIDLSESNMQRLEKLLAQQQQILDSISRQDSQGQYLPRLDANMANPEFAAELKTAIEKTVPEEGTLVVRNTLPYGQVIIVNGEQHTVAANAFLTLRLPVGNVATQVPGGQPVNWFIGGPDYVQRIRLAF